MEPAFVYMMRCAEGRLYTGWTNDLPRRVQAHTSGKGAQYTRGFHATALVYAEQLASKPEAMRREAALKKLTKAEKEALCAGWSAAEFVLFRPATVRDTQAILDIYGWYVQNSTATLAWAVPTLPEYTRWVRQSMAKCPFILACDASGAVLGFACAHPWHIRESFGWSAETTIYLAPSACGKGIGQPFYHALLALLKEQGYYNAYALVASPNPASEALHTAMQFVKEADHPRCAYKFEAWCGLTVWTLPLRTGTDTPAPLQKPTAQRTREILAGARFGLPWQEL